MNNYWIDFWKEYSTDIDEKDKQSQVLRTLNKKPIAKNLWDFTLNEIDKVFEVVENDRVLDLCCGNGLLSKHFAKKGATLVAVDISKELLKNVSQLENIETIISDIRVLNFEENSFNKIILYAGIQYLNYKEAILMLQNIYKWLKPGGIALVGDVPDINRRWIFFNSKERQKVFFDNILSSKAVVGTWFEKEWFEHLSKYVGFRESECLPQNEKLIYANFRFDYLFKK